MSRPGRGATIYNLTLTNAGQEYPQILHTGDTNLGTIKAIMFRPQDITHTLQYSFKASGPYFDLKAGEVYWKDDLDQAPMTLYFKTPNAGAIVDIEVWS